MRTPEQIYKKYKAFCSDITKEEFINTINEIQKEVFNEGIDAAVETIIEIHKESFNEDMDKAVEVASTYLNDEKTSIVVNEK